MKLVVSVTGFGVALAAIGATHDKASAPLIAAPAFQSISALTFGRPGELYASFPMAATIHAMELPTSPSSS